MTFYGIWMWEEQQKIYGNWNYCGTCISFEILGKVGASFLEKDIIKSIPMEWI